MRLLFLIYSLGSGGAERVTCHLANYWASQGHDVSIATLVGDEEPVYPIDPRVHLKSLDIAGPTRGIFVKVAKLFRRMRTIRRYLKQTKSDVVIGMMTETAVMLAIAAIGLKSRTMGAERSYAPLNPTPKMWSLLRKHCYRYLDVVIAQTAAMADWISAHTSARQIETIANPIAELANLPPFINPADILSDRWNRKVIMNAGSLVPLKQHQMLIEIFTEIASEHPKWDLVILGRGPLHEQLKAYTRSIGMADRVQLPGRAGNMADWYDAADIFALTSSFEGFPNVLLEAMSSGTACIAFDCLAGPSDLISDEVNGLLIDLNDRRAMSAALKTLMNDTALRKTFAEAAKKTAENYEIEIIAAKWEKLFNPARKLGSKPLGQFRSGKAGSSR